MTSLVLRGTRATPQFPKLRARRVFARPPWPKSESDTKDLFTAFQMRVMLASASRMVEDAVMRMGGMGSSARGPQMACVWVDYYERVLHLTRGGLVCR